MAPSGADISIHEMSSLYSTVRAEARGVTLTTDEAVLMTHLVVWLLTFLSVLFFGLRIGAKCFRRAGLAVDDALLAAALAAILFYSVIASLELALGLGTGGSSSSDSPSSSLGPSSSSSSSSTNTDGKALILLDHVARTFCLTAAAWSKSAVAVTLLKVPSRSNPGKPWNPVIHGVLFAFIAVVNTVLAAAIIAHWFRCAPIAKEWDSSVEGSCWSMTVHGAISIAAQSFSGAMDVALVAIGLLLVWGPGLSAANKAGVLGLSFLGIVASAASITTAIEISTLTDSNFITANIRILLAASIETPLVIITASLPALKLFNKNHSGVVPNRHSSKPYFKHKIGTSSTSTTIRLIPATNANDLPPSTSQSSVFPPATPLRAKASFSSSLSGSAPARPPRPSEEEAGMVPGMFWADPTAPAALNGASVRSVNKGPHVNSNNNNNTTTSSRDDISRGLLLTPSDTSQTPSPYVPHGWGSTPSPGPPIGLSPGPGISPYNNVYPPHLTSSSSPKNNQYDLSATHHPVDAFDTYEPNLPALVAPRVLTPLEEEGQDYASSYRSSRVSESTMTNSHWLDIPVPTPDDETGSSRRESSKFSMTGFIDSYGARAASVLRKMDLIVPLGGASASSASGSGLDNGPGIQRYPSQKKQQQAGEGGVGGGATRGLNFGKAGNRDSPTLGEYWVSLPPSPTATTATVSTAPRQMGGGPWNSAAATAPGGGSAGGGMGRYPGHSRQPYANDANNNNNNASSLSSYTTYNRF